jgi:serine/threonine-protein kinase HipA
MREAYVWAWLPGQVEPVVAGRLYRAGERFAFHYGRSYLERDDALALYLPELPLQRGEMMPLPGLSLPGCLRDSAPDAWGRRVILNRLYGGNGAQVEHLDELAFLLLSGSDRPGALDFHASASDYVARVPESATLEELQAASALVEAGKPLSAALDRALLHGTSLGGARPKAQIDSADGKYIAKFSSSTDTYNVVKAEFVAMRLAARLGLMVADVRLEQAAGRDVLLVKRFDREKTDRGWLRRQMVSALTLFELDEMMARYASYQTLAEIVRHRFHDPVATTRELFARLVFNVICGNTDDHARNHAAFWDGARLALTPAYDICPQPRAGNEASQAMLIHDNQRLSRLANCLEAASAFMLGRAEAQAIIEQQLDGVREGLAVVMDEAEASEVDRRFLMERAFLNPAIFE